MKKHSRSLALLLGLLILLSLAACSGGGSDNTSDSDTDPRTPETTDIISAATTEDPSVSASASPETTTSELTDDTAPDTAPPVASDVIRILKQKDRGEALTSLFADGEEKTLLDEREGRLLREHLLGIEVAETDDIAVSVRDGVLTSENEYDLLLLMPEDGIGLLSDGMLENLAEAGIGITPDSVGINKSLTESLSVGGGVYLLSPIALTSDITSTYAVRYNGAPLSSAPVEMVLSGNFTVELMLGYIKETDSVFTLGEASSLTLYRGLGGKIFTKTESGIPTSAVTNNALFTSAYSAAGDLCARSTDGEAVFTLEKVSPLKSGNIYLPVPKANADLEYSMPVDHTTLSVFAAPAGVVSGNRLKSLAQAFISSSHSYREGVRADITKDGAKDSRQMLDVLEANTSLDLGILLGWGDIDTLIEDGLEKGSSADTILSDRMTEMRNTAVDVAANIVADRLGIK